MSLKMAQVAKGRQSQGMSLFNFGCFQSLQSASNKYPQPNFERKQWWPTLLAESGFSPDDLHGLTTMWLHRMCGMCSRGPGLLCSTWENMAKLIIPVLHCDIIVIVFKTVTLLDLGASGNDCDQFIENMKKADFEHWSKEHLYHFTLSDKEVAWIPYGYSTKIVARLPKGKCDTIKLNDLSSLSNVREDA